MARRTTIQSSSSDSRMTRSTISVGDQSKGERFTWENSEFEDAHEAFTRWVDHVRDRPSAIDRRKRNLLYASLYSNLPLLGFGVNQYTRNMPHQGRIALNATQNAIDSLTSKICKNRPRPMFTTVEGDYELQEKAENADHYIDGMFDEMGYYDTVYPGKVLDAGIYGLGVSKVHDVDGEGVVERTFPWEMIIDDRETLYGRPVHVGQRKYYDKQEAFDLYRKEGKGRSEKEWNLDLERTIDSKAVESDKVDFDRDESCEQVAIYEGWRTKTTRRPGKKIVCIRGKTFRFEDFNDDLPFNFLRPEVQSMGFYGIGICERVSTIQSEINRLVRDIQMAMHLIAKPHWMVESSSNVNTASLNNDIATIIKYTGATPPQVYTPQSMSSEVFQHLQYLVKTLYEITGISQLSAQSQKPAGLSSAVALRTYLNVETERFNNFLRAAEKSASLDALKLAKVIGGIPGKKKKVMSRSGQTGRTGPWVTWNKLDFDTIAVQVQPTSKLPDTPAGRREYVLELAQYTQVTTDDIFEMLEWPDTEAFAQERLATKKNVRRDFAKMRKGIPVIRDAIGDHKMAYKMALDAYASACHDELPQKRLDYFREYIKRTYRYLTGKKWVPQGPNPLPGEGPPPGIAPPVDPNGPPVDPNGGLLPPMDGPQAMLPPGAPLPPPGPMANGGMPMPPLPPQGP
jgi:hypothetical protein